MDAERSGRLSLKMDAAYCATVGAMVIAGRRSVGRLVELPPGAVAAIGTATVAWAGLVRHLASRPEWRRAVGMVAVANALVAAGLGAAAVRLQTRAGQLTVAAVATDVATFAGWQAIALRTAHRDHLCAVRDNRVCSRVTGSADD